MIVKVLDDMQLDNMLEGLESCTDYNTSKANLTFLHVL